MKGIKDMDGTWAEVMTLCVYFSVKKSPKLLNYFKKCKQFITSSLLL